MIINQANKSLQKKTVAYFFSIYFYLHMMIYESESLLLDYLIDQLLVLTSESSDSSDWICTGDSFIKLGITLLRVTHIVSEWYFHSNAKQLSNENKLLVKKNECNND